MGIADFILLGIIAILVVAAIVYLKKNSKNGGCIGCSGGCSGCSGHCASATCDSKRTKLQFSICKMQDDCSPKALEQALIGISGVTMVNVDSTGSSVTVTTNGMVNRAGLTNIIRSAGYSVAS